MPVPRYLSFYILYSTNIYFTEMSTKMNKASSK